MAKKEKDTRRISGYIVESQPSTAPPEGKGPTHTEPVRWYLEAPGAWTSEKKKARVFPGPSEAVRAVHELRSRLFGIEFVLAPAEGASMETRRLPGNPRPA